MTVAGVFLCLSVHAATAAAALLTITSRGEFNTDATLDWGQIQPACQEVLATPLTATSTGGLDVEVSHGGLPVALNQQVPPGCVWDGWNGDFFPTDALVWTGLSLGYGFDPLVLTFSRPIFGIGTQFGYAFNDQSFTAQIDAYSGNRFLGSVFNHDGFSTSAADNSAIFLGVIDTTGPNITSVVLSLINTSGASPLDDYVDNDFSINQLSLIETPEPASLLLVASGLFAVVRIARRRSRRQA